MRVGVVQSLQSDNLPEALADIFMTPGAVPVPFKKQYALNVVGLIKSSNP